jgi:hypothetical protein
MNTTSNTSNPAPATHVAKTTTARKPQAAARKKAVTPVKAAPTKAAPTKVASQTPATKPVAKKPAVKPVVKKQAATPAKPLKDKKVKVVRDSFTIPKAELLQIGEMKKRALGLGVEIKKSELIRAGLQAIASLTDASFKKALASVPTIKTGRPAKS